MKIIRQFYSLFFLLAVATSLQACGLAASPVSGNAGGAVSEEGIVDLAPVGTESTGGSSDPAGVSMPPPGAAPGPLPGPISSATGVLDPTLPGSGSSPGGSSVKPVIGAPTRDLPCFSGPGCDPSDTIDAKSDPDHILEPQEINLPLYR